MAAIPAPPRPLMPGRHTHTDTVRNYGKKGSCVAATTQREAVCQPLLEKKLRGSHHSKGSCVVATTPKGPHCRSVPYLRYGHPSIDSTSRTDPPWIHFCIILVYTLESRSSMYSRNGKFRLMETNFLQQSTTERKPSIRRTSH